MPKRCGRRGVPTCTPICEAHAVIFGSASDFENDPALVLVDKSKLSPQLDLLEGPALAIRCRTTPSPSGSAADDPPPPPTHTLTPFC